MGSHTVVLDPKCSSRAQEMVRTQLMDDLSSSSKFDDVRLAINEVVAMFVRHDDLVDSSSLNVDIHRTDHQVRVTVSRTPPHSERSRQFVLPLDSDGGYGLKIIEGVSDRWGVEEDPPSVWFEISRLPD